MKKIGIFTLLLLTIFTTAAMAESKAPAAQKRSSEDEKKLAETRKQIEEKRTDLNGTSWELTMMGSQDPKLNGVKDTFIFQNGEFKSVNFMKRGFPATNYTVSIPSATEESGVWETMQTGKEGLIFIRGEWAKDKMQGNISEQLDGGKKVREYGFSTDARKAIPATLAVEKPAGEETTPSATTKETADPSKAIVSTEKK